MELHFSLITASSWQDCLSFPCSRLLFESRANIILHSRHFNELHFQGKSSLFFHPLPAHLVPPRREWRERGGLHNITSSQSNTVCMCVAVTITLSAHTLHLPHLPLVATTTTTSNCSSAFSGSRAAAHSDDSHASEEKFSTLKSRGAAGVWGRHPASRGTGDVAPYQS